MAIKTKLKAVTWQLPPDLVQAMEEARWALRMPKQRIAEVAIREYLERQNGRVSPKGVEP